MNVYVVTRCYKEDFETNVEGAFTDKDKAMELLEELWELEVGDCDGYTVEDNIEFYLEEWDGKELISKTLYPEEKGNCCCYCHKLIPQGIGHYHTDMGAVACSIECLKKLQGR